MRTSKLSNPTLIRRINQKPDVTPTPINTPTNSNFIDEFAPKAVRHPSSFKVTMSHEECYKRYFSFVESTPKVVIFIHSCNLGNTQQLKDLCNLIISTRLIEKVDWVYINNTGIDLDKEKLFNFEYKEKFIINNYSSDTNLFELPTIYMLKSFSVYNKGVKILYLHTKGVSSYVETNKILKTNVKLWVDYMTYFLIEKHEECLNLLDKYYTVGVEFLKNHYSGNYWWGVSDYLATVKGRMYCKYDAEWWVLSNGEVSKYYCMYTSNKPLYNIPYHRHLYARD